jgi:hypothetical protein
MRTLSVKVVATVAASAAIATVAMLGGSREARADDISEAAMVTRGFQIAPVPLNMKGKDFALVGLGSFLVNAVGDCNGCHTSSQTLDGPYLTGSNPYRFMPGTMLPQMKKVDPTTYLGGGQDFSTVNFEDSTPDNPDIISRNLTPDKTGLPEGGHTLAEFMQIIKTGIDMDKVHPNLPDGFDGNLLQVMPWPAFQNMQDRYLHAIYEYLSAIPCLEGGPGEPANRCH